MNATAPLAPSKATGRIHVSGGPSAPATSEPLLVRLVLIGVALAFLGLFLGVPLAAVFAEAFAGAALRVGAGLAAADLRGAVLLMSVSLDECGENSIYGIF